MLVYTRKTDKNGNVKYRNVTDNVPVAEADLAPELVAKLKAAAEGTKMQEDGTLAPETQGAPKGSKTTPGQKVYVKNVDENNNVIYQEVGEEKVAVDPRTLEPVLLARIDAAGFNNPVPETADIDESSAPAADGPKKGEKTREIELAHPLLINGRVYKAGKHTVEEGVADDLERIDREHGDYENNLLRSQNLAREATAVKVSDIQG